MFRNIKMPRLAFKLCTRNFWPLFPIHLAEFLIDDHGKLFLYHTRWIFYSNFVVEKFLEPLKSGLLNIGTLISRK